MAQKDPWAEFEPVVAQPRNSPMPRPLLVVPDTGKAQEQEIQAQKELRDRQKFEQDRIKFEQDQAERATRRDATGGVDTTEAEKTAAFLATRVANGIRTLSTIKGGERPSVVASGIRSVFGDTAANLITGEDRQRNEAAQLDLLDAALTLGTGAAYTKEQLEGYRRAYFPQIGDEDATIADKRQRLNVLLQAARVKAGAAAPAIDAALSRVPTEQNKEQARQPEMRGGLPVGTQVQFGGGDAGPFDRAAYLKETLGITPDQEAVMIGFWNANRGNQNLTPEQVTQFYAANGLPAPDPAMLGQSIDQAKKGFAFQGLDTSQAEAAYRAKLEQRLNASGFDPNSAGAYGDRLDQGLLQGLADEFVGVGGGLAAAFQNEGIGTGYTEARDLERLKQEQMREAQGVSGYATELAGNFAGGLALPGATAGGVRGAAQAGATAGGIAGFGYGEGLGGSVGGAALGAGVGAGLGAGAGKLGDVMAARQAARIQNGGAMPSATADAYAQAQKYGMDLSIGDVRGMGAKATERLLDVQPGGAEVMNAARTRLTGQMERAADDVASTFGPETSFRGMGEAAQAGVKNWRGRFDALSEKLYNAIPIKPETNAALGNTVAALEELTNKITSNPKLAGMLTDRRLVGYLDALRGKVSKVDTGVVDLQGNPITREVMEGGSLSWSDLKQLRSRIGEEIGDQILGEGTLKSDLRRLYASLSSDMEATAKAQGAGAYRAFKTANDTYKAGQDKLERVWTSLLGKDGERTPEAAAGFIQRIAKEGKGSADLRQLAELRQTLKPDEWGQVSNGLIRLMGQPANSAGREFNPGTFMRVFDDMTPEAKNLLFGGANKPLRQNLDEFAQVIGRIAANDSTRNTSKTAMGLAGLTGFGLGGIPGVLGQAVMSYGAAKLWTSPSFVRWATGYSKMLAGAAKNGAAIKGSAFDSQMKALGRVASSDSVIAADALGLQRQLIAAFEQGPQRLAADPVDQAPVETTRTGPAGQ